MNTKTLLRMTASERVVGRYLRAPDHDASTGGGETSSPGGQAESKASEPVLSTADVLEKEFGFDEDPADDDSGEASSGEDSGDEDEDEDDDGDGEEEQAKGEDADDDDSEDDGEVVEKPKSKSQQKIDELTESLRIAERERDLLREGKGSGGDGDSADDEANQIPEEPDPSKFEYGENDLDYIKAVAKYDAKIEVLEENARNQIKAEAAALEAKWVKNLAVAGDKYPDFDEIVTKGAKEKKWRCSPVVAIAIKDSDYGPDIAYALASDPVEAARIDNLSPLEQAREFGRMEERHHAKAERAKRKAAKAEQEGAGRPRIVSRAPTPPKRQIRGGGGRFNTDPDTSDFAAFEKMADAKIKARRG